MRKSDTPPTQTWTLSVKMFAVIPFLGLIIILLDPPTWVEVLLVIAIVLLVATGSTLSRRRTGAWRPSETRSSTPEDEQ